MSAKRLELPETLAAAIIAAARRAYPQEACGLIEGIDTDDGWRAIAVHETRNLDEDASRRFLIDPQAHFALLRGLRGTERRIIGCFHSHPGGRAEPSTTDGVNACETGFLYVIAAGAPDEGFALGAFVFMGDGRFAPVALP